MRSWSRSGLTARFPCKRVRVKNTHTHSGEVSGESEGRSGTGFGGKRSLAREGNGEGTDISSLFVTWLARGGREVSKLIPEESGHSLCFSLVFCPSAPGLQIAASSSELLSLERATSPERNLQVLSYLPGLVSSQPSSERVVRTVLGFNDQL